MSETMMTATVGRLYPTARQERAIARIAGQCRALWNHWLDLSIHRYNEVGRFALYKEMGAASTKMRRWPQYQGLPARCGDRVVRTLSDALLAASRSADARKGFPRFKRRADKSDSFSFQGIEIGLRPGKVRLPTLGWIGVRGLQPIEGRRTVATVRQHLDGWQIAVQFEAPKPSAAAAQGPAVGIDLGLTHLVTLSTGEKIATPKFARKQATRLRRLEREKSRRRLGSVNRLRTVAKIGRLQSGIARRRKDFTHKLTSRLVQQHSGVAVEALNVRGLVRTRLARSISDAAFGEIRRQLQYKADRFGREYRELPALQRSTGVCPDCGLVGPKMPLEVREWQCAGCGSSHDRDTAAAQVILRSAVPPGRRKLVAQPRKRGLAVMRGPGSSEFGSSDGPPSNDPRRRAVGETP